MKRTTAAEREAARQERMASFITFLISLEERELRARLLLADADDDSELGKMKTYLREELERGDMK